MGITTSKQFLWDAPGWGFVLWLIGYGLGMVLFSLVPGWLIGWIITPIGTTITLWVLFKKVKTGSLMYYVLVGAVWLAIAVVCDYFFLVKAFHVTGYYKLDVYLYYVLTFVLPVIVGTFKTRKRTVQQ